MTLHAKANTFAFSSLLAAVIGLSVSACGAETALDAPADESGDAVRAGTIVGDFAGLTATDWQAVVDKLITHGTSVYGGEDGAAAYVAQVKPARVLGVTGFSGQWDLLKVPANADEEAQLATAKVQVPAAEAGMKAIFKALPKTNLRIVSGGTKVGVPKIAHEQAALLSLKTDAVSSGKRGDYVLNDAPGFCKVNQVLFLGDDWGKESATFLTVSDEMLLVGGGGQARKEAMITLESGKTLHVVLGTGGSADAIVDLVAQAQTSAGVDVKGQIFKFTAAQAARLRTYKSWSEAAAAAPTWLKAQ